MILADELHRFPLLADLTEAQCSAVAAVAQPIAFAPGQRIFGEGQPAERCWLIRSGRVSVEIPRPAAAATVVQSLGPGDVLGWSWLVPPHRWSLDAIAADSVAAFELDGIGLRRLADADPALGYAIARRLLSTLADRLHGTRARLLDLYRSPREP